MHRVTTCTHPNREKNPFPFSSSVLGQNNFTRKVSCFIEGRRRHPRRYREDARHQKFSPITETMAIALRGLLISVMERIAYGISWATKTDHESNQIPILSQSLRVLRLQSNADTTESMTIRTMIDSRKLPFVLIEGAP